MANIGNETLSNLELGSDFSSFNDFTTDSSLIIPPSVIFEPSETVQPDILTKQVDEIIGSDFEQCRDVSKTPTSSSTYTISASEKSNIEKEIQKGIAEANKKKKVSLDYATASQAKIYSNGILIDEAYDLQYSYKESKEPIYGYNSKYFDDMVGGTVIIFGAFTVNYRHDGYLYSILNKSANTSLTSGENNIKSNQQKYNDYLKKVNSYKELQDKIKQIGDKIKAENGVLDGLNATTTTISREYEIKKEDLKEKEQHNDNSLNEFLEDEIGEEDKPILLNDVKKFEKAIYELEDLKKEKSQETAELTKKAEEENVKVQKLIDSISLSNIKLEEYNKILKTKGLGDYTNIIKRKQVVAIDIDTLANSDDAKNAISSLFTDTRYINSEYSALLNTIDSDYTYFNPNMYYAMKQHIESGDDIVLLSPRSKGSQVLSEESKNWILNNTLYAKENINNVPSETYKSWLAQKTGIPTSRILFIPTSLGTSALNINTGLFYSNNNDLLSQVSSSGIQTVRMG
ncbi:MAG: hypothetical protein RBR68_13810 [Tenuifilaceae bacterium]|nr:hypothetical protein [Tenuifilaceae bacterium]